MERDAMIEFAHNALGIPVSSASTLLPLAVRGSGRTFYRFTWSEYNSAILVHYDPGRRENSYYADIAVFLSPRGVPVPSVIGRDQEKNLILMEDLGNRDLFSFSKEDPEMRSILYHKTLAVAKRLHTIPEKDLSAQPLELMDGFGPSLYRYEQDYFMDHFVKGHCGIDLEPTFLKELATEFTDLCERLGKTDHCLIHRDLQSQNVMIKDGEPYLIDFQGMRFGNLFYDLGSLLCDPYVTIASEEREEFLSFYYVLSAQQLDWEAFLNAFWEASVQRLMQALGAYGFLGRIKGLTDFLDHMPAGLDNLRLAVSQVPALPTLCELIEVCGVMMGGHQS